MTKSVLNDANDPLVLGSFKDEPRCKARPDALWHCI
jgi:hypothetical protein